MSTEIKKNEDNDFGEKLRYWIKANYKNVAVFCKEHDYKYFSVQNWINGHRTPSTDALLKLEALGFNAFANLGKSVIDYASILPPKINRNLNSPVQNYQVDSKAEEEALDRAGNFRFIRVLDVAASAGTGSLIYSEEIETEFAFNTMYLRAKGILHANLSVVRVKGFSMEPTLSDGEYVLVQHDVAPIDRKISLIRQDDEIFVKRMELTGKGWLAVSDNPTYEAIKVGKDSAIIGRAISAMKDL